MAKVLNLDDLLKDVNADLQDIEPVHIDVEGINATAEEASKYMVNELSLIYGDQEFMAAHPDYKKRLDIELESLRVLIKMRKSDELVHDVLLKSIANNPGNASLFRSLTSVQDKLIDIQRQMDLTIKTLNGLLKNYQLELNVFNNTAKENEEEPNQEDVKNSFRGTKKFIVSMQKLEEEMNNNKENAQKELFEDPKSLQEELFEDTNN